MAYKTDNPLKKALYWLCLLWMIVAIGALVMVITVWVMIIAQDLDVFHDTMGYYLGNDILRYPPGDPNNGYVDNTNIPKHLGGAVFATVFGIAMIIFCLFALAGDIFWRFPYARQWLVWTAALGLQTADDLTKYEYVFLWANALLKLFIVTATGSKAWSGLNPNHPDLRTPTFALYATFILLGSILVTFAVEATLIKWHKNEEWAASEAEKAKGKK
ncbi:hypothetical protein BD324DRAFT_683260 [Kockovaella imperatae]|uniref:Uncharacterized protein n=1 Tax=Kockovaella imperatae TaxID=4999 RepID=A0A1Y1UBB3_9TREE|nr:hypothetical protein BD324DRAFT_683260 [Kockovaella imperatae]ORX34824.1 hypothetical protein BD324DRAFT_683260 [Kockovaella imperatae]